MVRHQGAAHFLVQVRYSYTGRVNPPPELALPLAGFEQSIAVSWKVLLPDSTGHRCDFENNILSHLKTQDVAELAGLPQFMAE